MYGRLFFSPPFLSLLLKSFSSLKVFFSLFFFFFATLPPEGEITNPQKAEWHVLVMDKIQIFENVFHGNYVRFHGLGTVLRHSLDALICIETVIICSFQGENCIF